MNEIEMKAWVDDVETVKKRLDRLYEYRGEWIKEDTYFCVSAPHSSESGTAKNDSKRIETIRLREQDSSAIVTLKRKSVSRGMEVNEEEEFTVSDAGAFTTLLLRIGCTVCSKKRKHSYSYSGRNLTVELNHIDGLGWFLEVEKLCELPSDGEAVRGRLYAVFEELGISLTKIESRYYTDLLAEAARTGGVGLVENQYRDIGRFSGR